MALHAIQHGMDGRAIDRGGEEEHMCGFSNAFFEAVFLGKWG